MRNCNKKAWYFLGLFGFLPFLCLFCGGFFVLCFFDFVFVFVLILGYLFSYTKLS